MHVITVDELRKLKGDNSLFLLDVRENDEVESMPMDDMPYVHIPMNDVPTRLDEIDEEKHIIVFCKVGGRSARVCEYLTSQGYEKVSNLIGGILAWKN